MWVRYALNTTNLLELLVTYNEFFYDAIKFDEPRLAYPLYYLIKNNLVNGNDRYSREMLLSVPHSEVEKLMQENILNMNKIKLYSVPLGNRQHFILLAENEESARGHCFNTLGRLPNKIIDISHKMDMEFWFDDIKKYKTLREIKDETLMFPSSVMLFEKKE